jgi:DNA-binding MarR family transcriptional regulator
VHQQKVLSIYRYSDIVTFSPREPVMPRFRETIPVDDYVLDVLMRDLIGHDQQPAAYLVYLYLYSQATRMKWKPVTASLRTLADATGLSKSAIQVALATLRRRQLIITRRDHATACSRHRVLRHWRAR